VKLLFRNRHEGLVPPPGGLPPRPGGKYGAETPGGHSPRNRAPERVARGVVLTQAVLLAVEMARADDEIDPSEEDAIRDFVRNHVPEAVSPSGRTPCLGGTLYIARE